MANQDLARYTTSGPMPLTDAINQLMRDAFTAPFGFGAISKVLAGMNLYETADSYIVQVPLPGMQLNQMNVSVRENILTLQGTTEFTIPEGARSLYTGTGRTQFREQMQLPGDVNPDQAMASYENGVLTLKLPKAPSARERTIKVDQGQGMQRQGQVPGQGQAPQQSQQAQH